MARASPASTKTNRRNATKLGHVEGYLGSQCVPGMCLHWKFGDLEFYFYPQNKKVRIKCTIKALERSL